ncbi:hypothetical protein PILCRDRAFT_821857 [Piloderma croceum F 1598]|uniref:Uncharacterized protein n=1 Tax=Piloderma croceum (strain F 1598) TaxID=765440 RepID=A0A0C3FP62_PILCF|nr:hypothetical protein PILCRDRAFT_821857 [Piloderma croceum F 1598]
MNSTLWLIRQPKEGVVYVLPKLSSEQFNSVRAYFAPFRKDKDNTASLPWCRG